MREVKFHTLYSEPDGVREEIPALKGKDADITGVQLAGVDLAPDADGKANIPKAATTQFGLVKAHPVSNYKPVNNFGIYTDESGLLRQSAASEELVYEKNDVYHGIPPKMIDQAVRAGLLSNSQITDADYPAIHKTLGIEKEWVLKGTLTTENKDTGVNVDLTGCTEVLIKGWTVATGSTFFDFIPYASGVLNYVTTNGERYFVAHLKNFGSGFVVDYGRYANIKSTLYLSSDLLHYDWLTVKVEQITKFFFEKRDVVTECAIDIYAR